MRHRRPARETACLVALLAAGIAAPAGAQQAPVIDSARAARIDAVFSRYAAGRTPGCALAVREGGGIAHERGYGTASLEHGVPITPHTVFDVGSVSKQFTAASVILLALDGTLSLDDDVRRWLPELPDLGARVTLRHLLTHTSGWRDYTDLLVLAGWDVRDHTGDREAWDILRRQRALNFPPGSTYRYSNTGYFLLGEVVRRASGGPLREFARERIFAPLGMTNTRYLDDTRLVVPHRATGYAPGDSGGTTWMVEMSDWDQVGDGAVQTTVEDLAKWDANFDRPTVGGARLLELLQERGRLRDGRTIGYAAGLRLGEYRGVARVYHSGSWAGYRAAVMRFPRQRVSVLLTCNDASANNTRLAQGVADVLLDGIAARSQREGRRGAAVRDAERYAGLFVSDATGDQIRVEVDSGALAVLQDDERERLVPLANGRLLDPQSGSVWHLAPDGKRAIVELSVGVADTLVAVRPVSTLSAARMAEYAGTYASDELGVAYAVLPREGHLVVRLPRGDDVPLTPLYEDAFESKTLPVLRFVRDAAGRVTAISITTAGVHDLRLGRTRPSR